MAEGYNTNLAAKFHVLSILHWLGISATLTLGNKKVQGRLWPTSTLNCNVHFRLVPAVGANDEGKKNTGRTFGSSAGLDFIEHNLHAGALGGAGVQAEALHPRMA